MSESTPDRPSDQMPEGDDVARVHGEQILAMVKDAMERKMRGYDPFLEALNEAHRAEVEADKE